MFVLNFAICNSLRFLKIILGGVTQKGPKVLSRCHAKRRIHTPFGMTPTFRGKRKKQMKKKPVSYQKYGVSFFPFSFGFGTTQDCRDLFVCHRPNVLIGRCYSIAVIVNIHSFSSFTWVHCTDSAYCLLLL